MEKPFIDYLKKHNYRVFDIKSIIFDMDGVLYDSMKWHAKSWQQTMNEYKLKSTPDEFYLYEGMVGHKTIDLIIQREKGRPATDKEKSEIYKRKSELFASQNDGALIPKALDLVKKVVTEYHLQPVIVTGSGQPSLLDNLDKNFERMFSRDKMVTAYDVKKGKPDPEPYIKGLEKAGNLKPNQAIVVENAPMGVEAAVAAGIFTIAINTGPLDSDVLIQAGADIVLPSMEALYNNFDEYLNIIKHLSI